MSIDAAVVERSRSASAVLDALPHPVLMVAPDGKIAEANVAAESFFEVSMLLLRRHALRDLVPFGSPLLAQERGCRARANEREARSRDNVARGPESEEELALLHRP